MEGYNKDKRNAARVMRSLNNAMNPQTNVMDYQAMYDTQHNELVTCQLNEVLDTMNNTITTSQ